MIRAVVSRMINLSDLKPVRLHLVTQGNRKLWLIKLIRYRRLDLNWAKIRRETGILRCIQLRTVSKRRG